MSNNRTCSIMSFKCCRKIRQQFIKFDDLVHQFVMLGDEFLFLSILGFNRPPHPSSVLGACTLRASVELLQTLFHEGVVHEVVNRDHQVGDPLLRPTTSYVPNEKLTKNRRKPNQCITSGFSFPERSEQNSKYGKSWKIRESYMRKLGSHNNAGRSSYVAIISFFIG